MATGCTLTPQGVHEGLEVLLAGHRDSLRGIIEKELQQLAAQIGRLEDKLVEVEGLGGVPQMSRESDLFSILPNRSSELFDYSEQRANKRGREPREPPTSPVHSAANKLKDMMGKMVPGRGRVLQEGTLPAVQDQPPPQPLLLQVERVSPASSEELEADAQPPQPRQLGLCRRSVGQLVRSSAFDAVCGLAIVGNSVLIGVDAEYTAQNEGNTLPEVRFVQFGLSIWYAVELALRIVAEGPSFWCGEDYRWNTLDTVLVSTSVLDFVAAVSSGGVTAGRLLRSLRIARMIRTLRLVRVLRYVRDFRKMLYSLMASGQTLFWSLFLLFGLIYMFAVLFTQDVVQMAANAPEQADKLDEFFGSVAKSIYTLFMAVAAGIAWGEVVSPLIEADMAMVFLFLMFVAIIMFGVLNIVTSVFVESAMQSTQHYRELIVQEKMDKKEQSIRHMREIFRQMDIDQGGTITMREMQEFLRTDDLGLKSYFEALELNASDTQALFKLLDQDKSGAIDIDEFCEGCMRLKGEARSFDINCLMYETRRLENNMMLHMGSMQRVISALVEGRRRSDSISLVQEPAALTELPNSGSRRRTPSEISLEKVPPMDWVAEPLAAGHPGHGLKAGASETQEATRLIMCPDNLAMPKDGDGPSVTEGMIHC